MHVLSKDGKIYFSHYQQVINDASSLISSDIISPALFYQLPLYSDELGLYLLERDVNLYFVEYYFIHSLYGSIMYLLQYTFQLVNSVSIVKTRSPKKS